MEESETERLHRLLQQCLQQMGQECKRILFDKYWLNLDMKEIAERMGFPGIMPIILPPTRKIAA